MRGNYFSFSSRRFFVIDWYTGVLFLYGEIEKVVADTTSDLMNYREDGTKSNI